VVVDNRGEYCICSAECTMLLNPSSVIYASPVWRLVSFMDKHLNLVKCDGGFLLINY